jgi:hypothetical protein
MLYFPNREIQQPQGFDFDVKGAAAGDDFLLL